MSIESDLCQESLKYEVPLVNYNSWRVGGVAQRVYLLNNLPDLSKLLKQLPIEEPIHWLGLGSNVLIRDGGISGTTIIARQGLTQLAQLSPGKFYAGAAVSCAQLARYSAKYECGGLEFLAGIPGTVGGALRMNAGCFQGEIWQFVKTVEMIDRQGECHLFPRSHFDVGYRAVKSPINGWFVGAYFDLKSNNYFDSLKKIRKILKVRCLTQPTAFHSCGSVFRNPDGDYAGRLIEHCGLKGYTIGGAEVSRKHANFIINRGHATASDIETLIQAVVAEVYTKTGIRLKREVKILGVTQKELSCER